jgi:hypothetical protein
MVILTIEIVVCHAAGVVVAGSARERRQGEEEGTKNRFCVSW